MCGRTALTASPADLRDAFGLDDVPSTRGALQRAAVAPGRGRARHPRVEPSQARGAPVGPRSDLGQGPEDRPQARARARRDGRRAPERFATRCGGAGASSPSTASTNGSGKERGRARRSSCGEPTGGRSRSRACGAAGSRRTARSSSRARSSRNRPGRRSRRFTTGCRSSSSPMRGTRGSTPAHRPRRSRVAAPAADPGAHRLPREPVRQRPAA